MLWYNFLNIDQNGKLESRCGSITKKNQNRRLMTFILCKLWVIIILKHSTGLLIGKLLFWNYKLWQGKKIFLNIFQIKKNNSKRNCHKRIPAYVRRLTYCYHKVRWWVISTIIIIMQAQPTYRMKFFYFLLDFTTAAVSVKW